MGFFIENQEPSADYSIICSLLIQNRLCNLKFLTVRPARKWLLLLLKTARILFRDKGNVCTFHQNGGHDAYVQLVKFVTLRFLRNEFDWSTTVAQLLNITQKLIGSQEHADRFAAASLQTSLVAMLATGQMTILQLTLEILGRLSDWSEKCREEMCETTAIDVCLQLIPEGDIVTQKLCVSLLRILSCEQQAREQIRIYDGVPTLLSLISLKNTRLQWHVAWTLAQLAEQPETAFEIAQLGGVSLVFSEMANTQPPEKGVNDWVVMLTGLSALLAQLCQQTANQQLIVNTNGVFLLGSLLSQKMETTDSSRLLQCSILRVLRLLFCVERGRTMLKKVLPLKIFEKFVDVGNYVQELAAYEHIANHFALFLEETPQEEVSKLWEQVNIRKEALGVVAEFELLDVIGSGAFGCVYTVRKKTSAHGTQPAPLFALKEIFMTNLAERELEKSVGDMINEVKIIKHQLRHPNIVRYRKIFVDNHRLYIVMDLVQGLSLKEHIVAVKEKKQLFGETTIWNIVVQLVLALRYLHKEKKIVHRDLKPNNIMLTESEKVVVTDFGLAKQRGVDYLSSTAGTIIYSCPEIVQNLPYGEKADIWSFGCCIYELCALEPTFNSTNMLALATQIVEATYQPLADFWTSQITSLVAACLQADPTNRPDIGQVAHLIAPQLLEHLDELTRIQAACKQEPPSLNSSTTGAIKETGSYERLVIDNRLPKITATRRNHSLSAGDNTHTRQMAGSCSLPRIQQRRPAQKSAIDPPTRSCSSTDLKVSDGVSVRTAALKQCQDPVLLILSQIHRILIVTDRVSVNGINHQRRLVEMFKRKVMGKECPTESMKKHLRKLAAESQEIIDVDLGFSDYRPALAPMHSSSDYLERKICEITYEQLAACISHLMSETTT